MSENKKQEMVVEFEKMGYWSFDSAGSVSVRQAPKGKADETLFDMVIPFNWDGTPKVDEIKEMMALLAMCLPQDEPICVTGFGGYVYAWELAYTLGKGE